MRRRRISSYAECIGSGETGLTANHLSRAFGRLGAVAASAAIVSGFLALLTFNFRPAPFDNVVPSSSFVSIETKKPVEEHTRLPRRYAASAGARSPVIDDMAQARQALQATLACLNPRPEKRPPQCADLLRPPRPDEFAAQAILPARDREKEKPLTSLEGVYSRAEQTTLVMPPCTGVCGKIGRPPPPPTRTPEQICRDKGIGPCTEAPPPPKP